MSEQHHGGQAFPNGSGHGYEAGMTLRDYFAGQALAGLLANPETPDQLIGLGYEGSKDLVAKFAYAAADAMLKARAEAAKKED